MGTTEKGDGQLTAALFEIFTVSRLAGGVFFVRFIVTGDTVIEAVALFVCEKIDGCEEREVYRNCDKRYHGVG